MPFFFNFNSRIKTHLSNIAVSGFTAHVGVENAVAVEVTLHSRGPHTLQLKEGQNIFR